MVNLRDIKKQSKEFYKESFRKYNLILVNGLEYSSFSPKTLKKYSVNKNNIYLNKEDIEKYKKKKVLTRDFVNNSIVCTVDYIGECTEENIIKGINNIDVVGNLNILTFNMYHVFVVDKIKNIKYKNKILKHSEFIKICTKEDVIDLVEDLMLNYDYELNERFSSIFKDVGLEAININRLNNICETYFFGRLRSRGHVPVHEYTLYTIYKNAFLKTSVYQSISDLHTYISVLLKTYAVYFYCKNHDDFNKDLTTDNIDKFYKIIMENISEEDFIYKYLNSTEKVEREDFTIIKRTLRELLDVEIENNKMSFYEVIQIIKLLRNKIEAHGSLTDNNAYLIWYVTLYCIDMLSSFLCVDLFQLGVEDGKVCCNMYHTDFKFDKEDVIPFKNCSDLVYVDKYITYIDNMLVYLSFDSKVYKNSNLDNMSYINYLTGDRNLKKVA